MCLSTKRCRKNHGCLANWSSGTIPSVIFREKMAGGSWLVSSVGVSGVETGRDAEKINQQK